MAAPAVFAGLAPKLAKAWPAIQKIGNWTVLGGADTPGQLAMNLGMSLAPNAIFAGMSAASLPENASVLDRGLAFGEQFLGSAAVELGAQGLATGGLRMAGNRMGPMAQNMLRSGIAFGAPTAVWGSGLMPQPTATRVWGDYQEGENRRMQAEVSQREWEIAQAAREQAFSEMAGFGPMRPALQGMYPGGFG